MWSTWLSVASAPSVLPTALGAGHHCLCFIDVVTKTPLVGRACSIEQGTRTESVLRLCHNCRLPRKNYFIITEFKEIESLLTAI